MNSASTAPFAFHDTAPAQCEIAVIGGGFCGLMSLAHLCSRHAIGSCCLFERSACSALGVAYGACDDHQLLNVPAARMGAYAERPVEFYEWLQRAFPQRFAPDAFVPRALYGRYLVDTVRESTQSASHSTRVTTHTTTQFVSDAVIDLSAASDHYKLTLASGRVVRANGVIVAVGIPQASPPWCAADARAVAAIAPRVLAADAWSSSALDDIAPDATVVLVGSGLTAMDMVSSLRRRGHRGKVFMLSRHGRLPLPHASARGAQDAVSDEASRARLSVISAEESRRSPQHAFRALREAARALLRAGHDWQAAIDSARPHTIAAWQAWSESDRAYFMHRLRSMWEIHRHRAPRELIESIERECAQGSIELLAGTVESMRAVSNELVALTVNTKAAATRTIHAARVINCTGPMMNLAQTDDAAHDHDHDANSRTLLAALLRRGMASVDKLGLGLRVDSAGQPITAHNTLLPRVRVVGGLLRGSVWESTAVPELRVQVATATQSLASELRIDRENKA